MKIWITEHCKDRYAERVMNGKRTDVINIVNTVIEGKDITNKILDSVPRYILYLYEKYGEFGQKIIQNGDIIFILKRKDGTIDTFNVLTCYVDKDLNHFNQYKNTNLSRKEIYIRIIELKRKMKK